MVWLLYNLLFLLGFSLMLPRFLYRMARRGGYAADFTQRFGRYTPEVRTKLAEGGRIWLHAVSVGELFVAQSLMAEWRKRQPSARFVLSTTTSTGYALARKHTQPADTVIYFPVDFPWVTRKVLDLIRPAALILVELELWPNLVRIAHGRNIPVFLINGRVSDHSFRGYQKVRAFTSRILPMLEALCCQSAADADRLIRLGAPPDRTFNLGSAKYDVSFPEPGLAAKAKEVLERIGFGAGHPILLAGSTWDGEEAILADAFLRLKKEFTGIKLVLVPRHVERLADVLKELEARRLGHVLRTKADAAPSASADVLVIDTTGELKQFLACADVVFIGKSLTKHGGQNIIEPAIFSKPILVGPHMENFASIMPDFLEANALVQVPDAETFFQAARRLFAQPDEARAMGERAAALVRGKSGAVGRTLDRITANMKNHHKGADAR